jgi:hypothetical protein
MVQALKVTEDKRYPVSLRKPADFLVDHSLQLGAILIVRGQGRRPRDSTLDHATS